MGQIILIPLRRKACRGFFHIGKNPTASVGIEPANSGTRGQQANHQTTEAVYWKVTAFSKGYSKCGWAAERVKWGNHTRIL
jgi:hypothetical protein